AGVALPGGTGPSPLPLPRPAGKRARRGGAADGNDRGKGLRMTGELRVTEALAAFLVASRWEDIPAAVRHEGVRSLLNFVGGALGGCRDEAVSLATRVLMPYFGPAQATIIGRSERPDALNAAFLNAISANVLEYDDTHLATVIHPAAPVVPGLLALAERRPVSGIQL